MLLKKESVLNLKQKHHNIGFLAFKLSTSYHPLNIIFVDFGIWWLGCRIEYSCLYIPQGHFFISTLWLWSTDEYVFSLFLGESLPLNNCNTIIK